MALLSNNERSVWDCQLWHDEWFFKVLNNNILKFSKIPLIKSPRDLKDQYFAALLNSLY